MRRALFIAAVCAPLLVLVVLVVRYRAEEKKVRAANAEASASVRADGEPEAVEPSRLRPELLYGRIVTTNGKTYEGRLRWGGRQEAFWDDYFDGSKVENPWLAYVPADKLPKSRSEVEVLGLVVHRREVAINTSRRFMARFGDITRIELLDFRNVRVTLKSGTAIDLNRHDSSDFDDGLRVWDAKDGAVDLDSLQIRSVELLPTAGPLAAAGRLYGTVRTRSGEFTGFIQWDREECMGSDTLDGGTVGGDLSVRFDTIRSLARHGVDSTKVTLNDGRELLLTGTNDVGRGNRGVFVDDPRYGRVLISWDYFERLDFTAAGSSPAYADFPPGRPLKGTVTTHDGRRLAGRLVYDLDESETVETFDARFKGVDYTIPFGIVASIVRSGDADGAKVTLVGGEELQLDATADLGTQNAGILVFVEGNEKPEYVTWKDVTRVEFERPPA